MQFWRYGRFIKLRKKIFNCTDNANYAFHFRQNSETCDILHAFLSLDVAKLSDLKNSPIFVPRVLLLLSVRPSRLACNVLDLSLRLSVCPFVCYQLMNAIFRKRMNRFQCKLAQIFRGGATAWTVDLGCLEIKGQSHRKVVIFFWKPGRNIIINTVSWVDRGMQWATEMLPLKRRGGLVNKSFALERLNE